MSSLKHSKHGIILNNAVPTHGYMTDPIYYGLGDEWQV